MDAAIGAACKRFAKNLRCTGRTSRAGHDVAAVTFAKPERFLERVGVRFVHLEAGILLADASASLVDPRLPLARRHLLDAHGDVHDYIVVGESPVVSR